MKDDIDFSDLEDFLKSAFECEMVCGQFLMDLCQEYGTETSIIALAKTIASAIEILDENNAKISPAIKELVKETLNPICTGEKRVEIDELDIDEVVKNLADLYKQGNKEEE